MTRVDFVPYGLHLLGDITIHPDRFDAERGEAHYRAALALAEPRGMRPLVAHRHYTPMAPPPSSHRQRYS